MEIARCGRAGGAKCGDCRDRFGPPAPPPLLRPPSDERRHREPLPHDQRPAPLRSAQLVPRKREEIGAPPVAIDRGLSRGLDRIDEERNTQRATRRSHLDDRLQDACFVVRRLEARERGSIGESRRERLRIDASRFLARDLEHVETRTGDRARRIEDRTVLDRRHDDAPSVRGRAIGHAADRGGVRFGPAAREHDVAWGNAGQRRDLGSCCVEERPRRPSFGVNR